MQTSLSPLFIFYLIYLFIFGLLGAHLWHMEVPRLRVELELQLLAYPTDTATPDLSHVYNLDNSPQQRRILTPSSEARDGPHGC